MIIYNKANRQHFININKYLIENEELKINMDNIEKKKYWFKITQVSDIKNTVRYKGRLRFNTANNQYSFNIPKFAIENEYIIIKKDEQYLIEIYEIE